MNTHRQNRRNRPLQVESLESLMLLSGLAAPGSVQAPALVSAAAATTVTLNGSTKGTFYTTRSNPDTGTNYHIFTLGKTIGGVAMAVFGTLTTPGNINNGMTTGTLTIFTGRGSLTLTVTGPAQAAFSPLPSKLGFTITGGTGLFAHNHTGSGTIAVTDHVTGTTSGPTLASFSQIGTIGLVFKAGSPVV